MRAAIVVVALALAACTAGAPVRDWTLDVGSGNGSGEAVELPSSLIRELPLGDATFTLRSTVPLAPELRGAVLTLHVDCYHGDLVATANGVPLEDRGDTGVGEHRFVVTPAASVAAQLAFELTGRHDRSWKAFGFGATPRLERGIANAPSTIAQIDRYAAIVGIVLSVVTSLLFATLYVLDRRQRTHGVFAVQSIAALAWLGWELGVCPPMLLMLGAAIMVLAILAYLHLEFELGAPPRVLVAAYIAYALASPLAAWSTAAVVVCTALGGVLWLVVTWHVLRHLLRIVVIGPRSLDARILLAGFSIGCVALLPLWLAGAGYPITQGLHVEIVAFVAWPLAQALILAHHHVARARELEATAAELRRQVAERSKDLSDALAKLAAQPAALADARVIDGRYRVLAKLGAGGMGIVYEVERIVDRAHLALKTLRGQAEREMLARFAREAQVAAALDHPNIVPVLDVGIADGVLFLVMPLVDGGSLDQQRTRFGDRAWARPVLAQIARGLAALHEHGIVHRDLKPANVLLGSGIARITDFGLAATRPAIDPSAETMSERPLTGSDALFGTPKYMAPELSRGVRDVAASADVFAFGVLAYEMLTGKPPFAEPLVYAKLAGQGMPRPAHADIDPIFKRCIDLVPAARPTAAELVSALT